jgi:hypothetical protein
MSKIEADAYNYLSEPLAEVRDQGCYSFSVDEVQGCFRMPISAIQRFDHALGSINTDGMLIVELQNWINNGDISTENIY